ncbi:MAG: hypothetical protein R3E79_10380 [Caldilineaceae bacterium]
MSTETFLQLPEKATAPDLWSPRGWLPAWAQVRKALTLQVDQVIAPWDTIDAEAVADLTTTSMRQGIGLIVTSAFLGGLLPFWVNWWQAARIGTALPLVAWARYAEQQSLGAAALSPFVQAWTESVRTLAGLPPNLPGWLAAGISALGAWVNWPLAWLTLWLVYGLGVLVVLKVQGATTTLPHFYAATSYAFVPLVLLGLRPLPYLGLLFALVGIVWAALIYGKAIRTLTPLSLSRVVVSLLAPLAFAVISSLAVLGFLALVFLPLFL